MQNFQNLLVWKKAHELALLTYRLTSDFPREEAFGLRTTLRRTSVDIAAKIAEGCGKPNDAEFDGALLTALGYSNRLEYFALLSRDLAMMGEVPHTEYQAVITETKKLLNGFRRRLVQE